MARRSRKLVKTKNELKAWFKRNVPTSDPENPRTLPLPDEELFKYSPRRSERVAARNDHPLSPLIPSSMNSQANQPLPDFDATEYQQQLVHQPFDNDVNNGYNNYQWDGTHPASDFIQSGYQQMNESSESDLDDDDEYIPQGIQRTITAARAYSVQRPSPSQSAASSSSQASRSGVKKRKYTLKKDKEREDPEYREKRDKNNEAVERSREKKKRQEREEREKSIAMREIIKMFMRKEGENGSARFASSLKGKEETVFDEIFRETFTRSSRTRHHAVPNCY